MDLSIIRLFPSLAGAAREPIAAQWLARVWAVQQLAKKRLQRMQQLMLARDGPPSHRQLGSISGASRLSLQPGPLPHCLGLALPVGRCCS